MNIFFYSLLSGLNIVTGCLMFILLTSKTVSSWAKVSKVGFGLMAAGLIGQAIYVLTGSDVHSPVWEQFWVLKDFGILVFSFPLFNKWVEQLGTKD